MEKIISGVDDYVKKEGAEFLIKRFAGLCSVSEEIEDKAIAKCKGDCSGLNEAILALVSTCIEYVEPIDIRALLEGLNIDEEDLDKLIMDHLGKRFFPVSIKTQDLTQKLNILQKKSEAPYEEKFLEKIEQWRNDKVITLVD